MINENAVDKAKKGLPALFNWGALVFLCLYVVSLFFNSWKMTSVWLGLYVTFFVAGTIAGMLSALKSMMVQNPLMDALSSMRLNGEFNEEDEVKKYEP
jgi:hypothetical protein